MSNLMLYTDFSLIDEELKDAKCEDCKRMHCQLRQVFEKIICNDCYQKQTKRNPDKFDWDKYNKEQENATQKIIEPAIVNIIPNQTQQQVYVDSSPIVNQANPGVVNISGFKVFGFIILGVLALSGVILAIYFGLTTGGII